MSFFESVESGMIHPYTSNVVIMEILYILTRVYKFAKNEVLKDLRIVLNLRNLTPLEETDTAKALSLFEKFSIKIL